MPEAVKNVLISIPSRGGGWVYLPTIWANLKSYCERTSATVRDSYRWLDPVIVKQPAEAIVDALDERPHVLGLSCYCWNSDSNYELARLVRERYPDCLVLAGGPDPDYKNIDYFGTHPYVDAVVIQDGEGPFCAVLERLAAGELRLDDVPGLILPGSGADGEARYRSTGPQEFSATPDYSPWLDNDRYLSELILRLKAEDCGANVTISWETDRGCPYRCTYCDWGSLTHSKIRRVPIDRLREEAMWIGRNEIDIVSFTAANFGILPQDADIVDALIEANARYGYPKSLQWNNAKNNVGRVVDNSRKAYAAGLIDFHVLSVQSLDPEVLTAMGRSNISKRKQLQMMDELRAEGMPTAVQLIFGGPVDDLERFTRTMTDLMEWGVHDEYVTYPFLVLPNAPANDPVYREKWGIRTVRRLGTIDRRDAMDPLREGEDKCDFVVATCSFDEDEYIEMYLVGRFVIALHNSGLTQLLARYLRQTHGVSYHSFYELLMNKLFRAEDAPWADVYRHCGDHLRRFVGDEDVRAVEHIEVPELTGLDYLITIEEYVLYRLASDVAAFYRSIRPVLARAFGAISNLDSLFSYQRSMIIDPTYDRRTGRTVALRHDWPGYFRDENLREDVLPEPDPLDDHELVVRRSHSGSHGYYALDWHERSADPRDVISNWVRSVTGPEYTRARRSHFHDPADLVPGSSERCAPLVIG